MNEENYRTSRIHAISGLRVVVHSETAYRQQTSQEDYNPHTEIESKDQKRRFPN
jgi:hypothetical protein